MKCEALETIVRPGVPDADAGSGQSDVWELRRARDRVFRPGRRGTYVVAIGAAVAVAAGIAAFAIGSDSARRSVSLAVERVTLTERPSHVTFHCPRAEITYTATIAMNGSPGVLRFRWTGPDDSQLATRSARVRSSVSSLLIPLTFTFTGDRGVSGSARFHLISPRRSVTVAAPVRYECP